MSDHEYIIRDGKINREKIIYSICVLSSIISGVLYKYIPNIPNIEKYPFLYIISSLSVIYAVLFYFFSEVLWKYSWVSYFTGVKDLTGKYDVIGQTKDNNGEIIYDWNASLTIQQSWNKINIFLQTTQSSSSSVIAELTCMGINGYKLVYCYANNPKVGEQGLQRHTGVAELHFSNDLSIATGDYFNKGRNTFGQMNLKKMNIV